MTDAATPAQNGSRRRIIVIAGCVAAVAVLVWLGYYFLFGRYKQSTEDAYTQGYRISLAAQVSGTVVAVNTDNTQFVREGQLLVALDPTDAKVALAQAEAKLGSTLRTVVGEFKAVTEDRAGVESAKASLVQAAQDLARDKALAAVNGVSKEEFQHSQAAYQTAAANLKKAQNQLEADRARVSGTTVETNPDVKLAEAQFRAAWLMLRRMDIRAPASGYVSQKNVNPGDQISPSIALMTIVPMDKVWVDANYKETELSGVRIGQPVTLTAGIYGSRVKYHGHVLGFAAGTGSAFSLLPPENASGNWIKVVQRLPVRIGLDAGELAKYPLPLGISMDVTVDTRDRSGPRLSLQPAWKARLVTGVYGKEGDGVNAVINRIVAENLPDGNDGSTQ